MPVLLLPFSLCLKKFLKYSYYQFNILTTTVMGLRLMGENEK